jgi:hypothetical protein
VEGSIQEVFWAGFWFVFSFLGRLLFLSDYLFRFPVGFCASSACYREWMGFWVYGNGGRDEEKAGARGEPSASH